MSDPKAPATVTHSNLARPPVLLDGKITPKVCHDYEYHCETFFVNALDTIPEDKKVARILGCFRNSVIADWSRTERERLSKMTFGEFMIAFRKRWLPSKWEQTVRTELMNSRLYSSQTFDDWTQHVLSLNVSLQGTPSHMSDAQLKAQLENAQDNELRVMVLAEAEISKISELHEWIDKVREIDVKRQFDNQRVWRQMKEFQRTSAHQASNSRYQPYNAVNRTTRGNSAPAPDGVNTYPPKLTDDERRLLFEHDGCLKCRTFYAGHRANKCTITLSGKDYKTRTAQDALRAKALKSRTSATPVASITEMALDSPTPTMPTDLVAAIFPSSNVIPDRSMSETPESSLSSVSAPPPLKGQHLLWDCALTRPSDNTVVKARTLIDSGSHLVLVRPDLVSLLRLTAIPLPNPERISVAVGATERPDPITHYVVLQPRSLDKVFLSKPMHAVVAPGLCLPLILRLPFLTENRINCDYAERKCMVTTVTPPYNLLVTVRKPNKAKREYDILAAITNRIQTLSMDEEFATRETEMRTRFAKVFEPPPHADELPKKPLAHITLKDANKMIKTRNYPCPRKWKEAWHTLLQQHLDAGRIQPSSAPAGSAAFIIPKADPTVLPRWVNDYRQLNSNTVTDSFPIPLVNDILTDVASGRIFATIDMTNSFFQTRMHPDDVGLTAVNTPWGLYEWLVMPMGIKNAPAIQQRRVTEALRPWIGKICHVYIDNIAIWSRTVEEHTQNVATILQALEDNKLFINPKKTKLFSTEIRFLGHRIMAKGIEADEGKADRVKKWPTPTCAKHVRAFLGLVRYLSSFLPHLAEQTRVLDELTTKECDKSFPQWSVRHQAAFDAIKTMVTSTDCLTTIDPSLMPNYKIFVTTDASDVGSGAVLSFGPTYETARPVAYDSRAFKGAELNYPVHEKELLAIIRALGKWRTDLLGYNFEVWTDHKTLEHFGTQRDLSRRQARWMEFLSQYDATIHYLPGEKNTVADALSRLPDPDTNVIATIFAKSQNRKIRSRFELEDAILDEIKTGYATDAFAQKLISAATGMPNVENKHGFWFVDERLVIPNGRNVRETLFRIAHDKLGHFGTTKTYDTLRDSFYWPNM